MPPAQPRDFGSAPRKRPPQTRGTHGCCLHPALGARPGARFAHKQGRQQRRVEKKTIMTAFMQKRFKNEIKKVITKAGPTDKWVSWCNRQQESIIPGWV